MSRHNRRPAFRSVDEAQLFDDTSKKLMWMAAMNLALRTLTCREGHEALDKDSGFAVLRDELKLLKTKELLKDRKRSR